FAHALAPWIGRCGIAGLKLAVENTPETSPEDLNRLFALLPRGGVGVCLDVGHANLHPGTRNDYIGYLDRLRPNLPLLPLPLHEPRGAGAAPLSLSPAPAGRDPLGVAALLDRLARRGFDGSAILEQWPQPPEMLVQAREKLLELARGTDEAGAK